MENKSTKHRTAAIRRYTNHPYMFFNSSQLLEVKTDLLEALKLINAELRYRRGQKAGTHNGD